MIRISIRARASLGVTLAAALALTGTALRTANAADAPPTPAAAQPPDDMAKIEAAIPATAPAKPLKPRKLLIFDLNVGYGGHPSIQFANRACTLMGEKTGAFQTVISHDPAVFKKESLKQFDAVFLNNTVGNQFEDPELRRNLLEFVTGGGGLLGVHGTAVAFTRWPGAVEDWPEFGRMLGARGANHRASDEHVFIKLEEPASPLGLALGGADFDYRDEFFRVHGPYSRNRVRVVLSIDTSKTDPNPGGARDGCYRDDNDYALAWVRNYGQGRIFYSTIAHNTRVFWDPQMVRFYFAAIQFAFGDLPVPTVPSARLTPAIRAQERLGWRLGVEAYTFHKYTFFEAIDKTAQLGLAYMGGLSFQKVSDKIPKNLEPGLSDDELREIRFKLDDAGLRLLTYYIQSIPGDEEGCRKVFEFGRKLGIETFLSEPAPESLDTISRMCDEYGINVGLHNHDAKASPVYWNPDGILKACQGRSPRIGACADIGYWLRSGIDPIAAVRKLGPRLMTLQIHDLDQITPEGTDVPWGSGAAKTGDLFREIHRLGLKPTMFGLEYSKDWLESMPKVAQCAAFFDSVSLELAK